ncbi:transforming growth factor-beta receptor-associated protein 1 isoform X1 [Penaeus vannamei]|uniref:transforming growth factor-beta receptor-associated protein 1 isoform X1 n=2 Tax=Penaeus vannamei TaxID=6689 RepID=UPI000F668A55|nr:transforming growth factor-beta receptor-associated protein 1-like isoform X1 [Penaeus vannamei]
MALKAFDLVSVLERAELKIECLEASGNDLYLGSEDSTVVHYLVEERTHEGTGRIVYSTSKISQKSLGTKKTVTQLKTASALGRLMALSDGNLYLLESDVLNTIGSGPKIKNVTVFCVNENPNIMDPFTVQLCVGKRRCIQICSLHEDRVSLLKELSTPEPVNIAMDGSYVCIAGQGQYCVFNVDSGASQDLFPYDPATTYPHVKRVAKEEFLLAGPGNLGMFVTAAGISERPPIQWTDGIKSLSYYHPYILTITNQFIRVYSLIDQQHKQTLNFAGGELLGNFDGQLYVAASSCISCLMPQPWTMQVQTLMDSERVEEAVQLAEHSGAIGMSQEQYHQLCRTLHQRAGFIKLVQGFYHQAQEYFIKGAVDVREVVSLYPGLLPATVSFMRAQPPLHQFADIAQAMHGDQTKIDEAKTFLINFLIHLRGSGEPITYRMEVDTAVIKLQAEKQSPDLLLFLESGDIVCNLPECAEWLQRHKQYFALSKLYRVLGDLEKSLEVLTQLVREEIKDSNFGGIQDLVDCLNCSADAGLVWRYANFILDRNASEGVRVFMETQAQLDPSKVLQTLQRYPQARLTFLHHLIDTKNLQEEKYHTELVLHYVDEAVRLMNDKSASPEELEEARSKLQDLLTSSSHYQPQPVLARMKGTELHVEIAAVYGRLGEHEKALSMLVHQLKDFAAAEQYCIAQSKGASNTTKSNIFLILLKIYLRPPPGGTEDDIELAPAIELLSVHAGDLEVSSVLSLLPPNWSLSIVHHYLRAALRTSMHQSRIKRIQQTLVKSENLQQKFLLYKLSRDMGPIPLAVNRICCVCNRGFNMCEFLIYPNGVMAHPACAPNHSVCPLTGTVFQVSHDNSSKERTSSQHAR